jgi:hypothetical protein
MFATLKPVCPLRLWCHVLTSKSEVSRKVGLYEHEPSSLNVVSICCSSPSSLRNSNRSNKTSKVTATMDCLGVAYPLIITFCASLSSKRLIVSIWAGTRDALSDAISWAFGVTISTMPSQRVARMSAAICGISASENPRMSLRSSGLRLLPLCSGCDRLNPRVEFFNKESDCR